MEFLVNSGITINQVIVGTVMVASLILFMVVGISFVTMNDEDEELEKKL